ncbi:MAG: phosphate ABC transporter substrate-binding protein PstS, partial [Actinomycetota bacterium]|nr:phosphate ABC transporter substrate-binding protein PstS [Actinomycetota bacterium]
MKLKRHGVAPALVTTAALVLAACGSDPNVGGGAGGPSAGVPVNCGGKTNLSGEGSSAQKNAMDVFIQAYQQRCS